MSDPLTLLLRDIHLPEQVSIWPLALGWWILIAMIVIAVLGTIYLTKKRKRTLLSALNLAKEELSRIEDEFSLQNDPVKLIRNLSSLLRRLCISVYPRSETASLTGKAWLEFLDRPFSSAHFTSDKGRILVEAPYRQQVSNSDVEFLLDYSRDWIEMVSKQKEN